MDLCVCPALRSAKTTAKSSPFIPARRSLRLLCFLGLASSLSFALQTTASLDCRDRTHAFYYIWYGTPAVDGHWQHWDHEVLPHWTPHVNERYPEIGSKFRPPSDLHSPFYPCNGPYSSRNHTVVLAHLKQMADAGIGVAVASWWGQADTAGTSDTQGVQTDRVIADIFKAAEQQSDVKLAFHLEPYPGRSAESVRADVEYLLRRFGSSTALFRWSQPAHPKHSLPVFYVYDSYHISPADWASILSPSAPNSLRGTPWDGLFVGLWLNHGDLRDLREAQFDAAYPYFASEASTFGATWRHWEGMSRELHRHNMLFFVSVGPGYDDTLIRPWNTGATRAREGGEYYRRAWQAAISSQADAVSITSFNEWGEGTQIEPACSAVGSRSAPYLDYGVGGQHLFLNLTLSLQATWAAARATPLSSNVSPLHTEEL